MEESTAPPQVPAPPAAPPGNASNASNASTTQAEQDALALGIIATELGALYATRDPLVQSLKVIEEAIARTELRAHQIMATHGVRGLVMAPGSMKIAPKVVYKPVNWDGIYEHITTTGEFNLLHRRLSQIALNERASMPPGIERMEFDEFTFTPAKGK